MTLAMGENNKKTSSGEGFVETIRNKGKIAFIHVKTKDGLLQLVSLNKEYNQDIVSSITTGSYVNFSGVEQENESIKDERLSKKEILLDSIVIDTKAEILPVLEGVDAMKIAANFRHLQLRTDEYQLQFEVASNLEYEFMKFFHEHGFIKSWSPKIIGTASEGGAEVFPIDFYGDKAYLAQSPQFAKQMMIASGFNKTFDISKAFRADPSKTSRHLAEFVSVDAEMVLSGGVDHHAIMDMQENLLRTALTNVMNMYGDRLKKFNPQQDEEFTMPPIPRIPLSDAKRILQEEYSHVMEEGVDIDPEGERLMSEYAKIKYGSDFVYLIDYPIEFRPFYHMVDKETGLTKSFDLLYKGVEISTGSQREHHLDMLHHQALTFKKKVNPKDVEGYLDLFKYGIPPHGGFGLGLERLIQKIVGRSNVKLIPLKAVSKDNVPF